MDSDDLVLNPELNFDILDQDIADLDYNLQGRCSRQPVKCIQTAISMS